MSFFRSAYVTVLKMCKLLLTVIGHVLARWLAFDESTNQPLEQGGPDSNSVPSQSPTNHRSPLALRHAVNTIFNQGMEPMIRNVAMKLASHLAEEVGVIFLWANHNVNF